MLVIKVELWPHGEEKKARELGRMVIANSGGTETRGDYTAWIGSGNGDCHDVHYPSGAPEGCLNSVTREGEVFNHARQRDSFWLLISKCLKSLGYEAGELVRPRLDMPEPKAVKRHG